MPTISPNKLGFIAGTLIGCWHLLWSIFILIDWEQPILDFIFWAHMINPVYVVKPFDPVATITLLVVTTLTGYTFGFAGALIWNKRHRRETIDQI